MGHGVQGCGHGAWGAGVWSRDMGCRGVVTGHGVQGCGHGTWGAGVCVYFLIRFLASS